MSHILRIFFVAILIGASLLDGGAQTTGKKKFVKPVPEEEKTTETKSADPKEETTKKEKEPSKWGFGINLGNIGFAGNVVQIGLDPNVAYRLADNFAVGFMMKMNYYHEKLESGNQSFTYNGWDWGPTLFTRWKPLLKMENATPFMQGIFLQLEYERAFISRPTDAFGNFSVEGDKIIPFYMEENYLYIGGGLSSGYPFGSFVSFHYNILDEAELSRNPTTFRIGFTWNY